MSSHNQTVKHQEAIHRLLNERSSMSIQELSDELNVSPSTIRRNVSAMVLMYPNMHRTHGEISIDAFVRDRNHREDRISSYIVDKALSNVRVKDKVFLDSGNTAMSLAM
ncbi:MAG: DeoR family transcriptional regulator, partial [Shewanella sp.]